MSTYTGVTRDKCASILLTLCTVTAFILLLFCTNKFKQISIIMFSWVNLDESEKYKIWPHCTEMQYQIDKIFVVQLCCCCCCCCCCVICKFCYKLIVICDCLTPAYPDAPQNLQVMSETWESIELQWIPGFDGGYEQEFVIVIVSSTWQSPLYRSADSSSTYNVTGCVVLC